MSERPFGVTPAEAERRRQWAEQRAERWRTVPLRQQITDLADRLAREATEILAGDVAWELRQIVKHAPLAEGDTFSEWGMEWPDGDFQECGIDREAAETWCRQYGGAMQTRTVTRTKWAPTQGEPPQLPHAEVHAPDCPARDSLVLTPGVHGMECVACRGVVDVDGPDRTKARVWVPDAKDNPPTPGPDEIGLQVRDCNGRAWRHERWTTTSGWWCGADVKTPTDGTLPGGTRFVGVLYNNGPLTEILPAVSDSTEEASGGE